MMPPEEEQQQETIPLSADHQSQTSAIKCKHQSNDGLVYGVEDTPSPLICFLIGLQVQMIFLA